jgi:hypothetical protein
MYIKGPKREEQLELKLKLARLFKCIPINVPELKIYG